jgi:uncharacterized protein with von Willebrand factor type A (vWA) domain
MVPERHNTVKVLLLLDIGGSMDDHVRLCEELFSARAPSSSTWSTSTSTTASTSGVWKTTTAAPSRSTPTEEVLRKYGPTTRLILVGDAA